MAEWRQFAYRQKAEESCQNEIIVQRMSADVTGKKTKIPVLVPENMCRSSTKNCRLKI